MTETTQREEPNLGWTEALGEHGSNPAAPRASGDTLLALGREWQVSSLENRIKAQFEQWVRKSALATISEIEAEQGADAAAQFRASYMGDRGAGHYNWDGRYCRSARGDVGGIVHLLYLLLRRCDPGVTPDKAEAIFSDNPKGAALAIGWAVGNSKAPAEQPGSGTTGKGAGAGTTPTRPTLD